MRPGLFVPTVGPMVGPIVGSVAACGLLACLSAPLLAQSQSPQRGLRLDPREGFTRVVLELPALPAHLPVIAQGQTLRLRLPGVRLGPSQGRSSSPGLKAYRLEPQGNDSVLTLQTSTTSQHVLQTLPSDGVNPALVLLDVGPSLRASPVQIPPGQITAQIKPRPPKRPAPTVVLDAGHGGIDPGTSSQYMGIPEKEVALRIALYVQGVLEGQGVKVVMTRSSDYARQGHNCDKKCDLDWRADQASVDRNVFVSIHVNSNPSANANGIETFVFGEPIDGETVAQAERENGGGAIGRAITQKARSIARDLVADQLTEQNLVLSRDLARRVQAFTVSQTGAMSRGVKANSLWVIRKARIPAILTEIGFATNPGEGGKLATRDYRRQIGQGIADGVLAFLNAKR